MIRVTLSYPPTSNHNTSVSNGRRISSAKYRAWRKLAEWEAKLGAGRESIQGPYAIHYLADRPDLRRRDLENLPKSLADSLQAAGVIRDDCDCQSSTIEWATTPPTKSPKVIVSIFPFPAGVE